MDGLLSGFGTVEGSISDIDQKLQENMDILDNVNNRLNKVGSKESSNNGRNGHPLNQTTCAKF